MSRVRGYAEHFRSYAKDLAILISKYIAILILISSLNYILARVSTSLYQITSLLEERSPGLVEALSRYYGFNTDPLTGLPAYMISLLRGDLGVSIFYSAPVADIVYEALQRSLVLIIPATLVTIPMSIIILIWVLRSLGSKLDRAIDTSFTVLMATPEVILAIIFAIYLPPSLFSAMLLLVFHEITHVYIFTRRNAVHILSEAYDMIEYYLAMGYDGRSIAYKELIRLSLPVVVASLAYSIATATPVLIFIETVFNYPGIGYTMFTSLARSDYPLASGCFLVLSSIAIGSNMVSDYIGAKRDWRLGFHGFRG